MRTEGGRRATKTAGDVRRATRGGRRGAGNKRLDRGAGFLTPDLVESELRSAGLVPRTLTPVTGIATGADSAMWPAFVLDELDNVPYVAVYRVQR
jgi:hypothetical protein